MKREVFTPEELEQIVSRLSKNPDYINIKTQLFEDPEKNDICAAAVVYRKDKPNTVHKIWMKDFNTDFVMLESTVGVLALKQAFETIGGDI